MKYRVILSSQARMNFHALSAYDSEDDWFDFRLENDPRFLKKIEASRASIRAGQGIPWEQIKKEDDERTNAPSIRRVSRRS